MPSIPHYINGAKLSPVSKTLPVYHPAKGELAAEVGIADTKIVNQAVEAAVHAFETWSQTTPVQRAKVLFRFKALLDEHIEELATLISNEHGKTVEEAIGSVQRGIDVVNYLCGIPHLLKGIYTDNVATGVDAYSLNQPLGVCVGITPFNFPGMIPLWMFPTAIACGNTFVLKPSEKDPSCAIRLVELVKEAGLADGVVNVVHGDKSTVDALITHPKVKAVSFVGSTPVAEYVYQTAIAHHKRAQAFGGAKNHCIIMPDANLNDAVDQIVSAAYGSAGERCMAISVALVVGEALSDQVVEKIKTKLLHFKIGSGNEKVDMGPLVTKAHLEKVQSYIALGQKEGASLVVDGSSYRSPSLPNGFFMGPCLFDHVTPSMRIYREEIFGPVLCIVRVSNLEMAINIINEHEYGNGTAIFTQDGYTARTFAEKVQVGMVGINVPVPVPVAFHSFGGWKRSIFADIGMYGSEAIRFYTKLKTVTSRWLKGA